MPDIHVHFSLPTPCRIKAQQALFQAQKKASGNTFTARGMPLNYFATAFIMGGGLLIIFRNAANLATGKGKIVLKDD